MFIRRKLNKSGTTTVLVVTKDRGRYSVVKTVGASSDDGELRSLEREARIFVDNAK